VIEAGAGRIGIALLLRFTAALLHLVTSIMLTQRKEQAPYWLGAFSDPYLVNCISSFG
jgi:hypothetical protein